MNVRDLIAQLQTVPDYCNVYLWVDGNRYAITDVDTSCHEDGDFIDINANVDTGRSKITGEEMGKY
jgi:hypothetical protein